MYKLIFVYRKIEVLYNYFSNLNAALSTAYFHKKYVGADEIIIYKYDNEVVIIRE